MGNGSTTTYDPSTYSSRRTSIRGGDSSRLGDSSAPPTRPSSPAPYELGQQKVVGARLLSDLWLMSAATFRRLGKLDEAKGAIQDAEERDYENPNVWVQVRSTQNRPYELVSNDYFYSCSSDYTTWLMKTT